jgi:hypothetical protein
MLRYHAEIKSRVAILMRVYGGTYQDLVRRCDEIMSCAVKRITGAMTLAFTVLLVVQVASAQQEPETYVEGYVTAIASPTRVDVNGKLVGISPATQITLPGASHGVASQSQPIEVGLYIRAVGISDKETHILQANSIVIRDDLAHQLSGVGVIEKIVESGAEAVFRADGYLIRITLATQLTFAGDQKNLAEITSNSWIHFEGKRDKNGVVIASKATFLPVKPAHTNAIPGLETTHIKLIPASPAQQSYDSAVTQSMHQEDSEDDSDSAQQPVPAATQPAPARKTKTRYSERANSLRVAANQKLQERVRRIGTSIIPVYQKKLPDNDPAKIHFQFTAVEAKDARWEICPADGLVLTPTEVAERLKSDDQLAAVLADGVALNMQRQIARLIPVNRAALGIELGAAIGGYLFRA